MARFIDADAATLMGSFQNACYEQTGRRMTIGSEEYTLASIFSYVLAAYSVMLNASYQNRFLSTAAGDFLDNIASQYGLSRSGSALVSPYFEGVFKLSTTARRAYAAGDIVATIADYTFRNEKAFFYDGTPFAMRFVCAEAVNARYTSADVAAATIGDDKPFASGNPSAVFGAASPMSDDEFRVYIERNKRLYSPGAAEAFEAAAISSQASVLDARTLRQSDAGFVPGVVRLYVKIAEGADALFEGFIEPSIADAIARAGVLTIGQTLQILEAPAVDVRPTIGGVLVSSSYDGDTASSLVGAKIDAICHYLNRRLRIGERLFASRIVQMMTEPLPASVDPLSDYGVAPEDFAEVQNFVILGASGALSGYNEPGPTAYLHVLRPTYAVATV